VSAQTTDQLLPRLLLGVGDRPTAQLRSHLELHGPLPELRRSDRDQMIRVVERAGVRGHGGAAFPVAVKLRAVASRRGRKIVLANGAEGEPASKKDRVLLRELPHLVLDGAAVAAGAVGAREAIVAVPEDDDRSLQRLQQALDERATAGLRTDPRFLLCPVPRRYITGQETALINYVNTGLPLPTFQGPRPFEHGVRQHPTLVQNVETLAHLALIARGGAEWFRQVGTEEDPGSALITLSGAVRAPGVYEIEHGMPLADLLAMAGAEHEPTAVLIGGYFGGWLPGELASRVLLARAELAPHGAALGAGVIAVLGSRSCPVAETARVADYLAAEGARQCGPCLNGLAGISETIYLLANGTAPAIAHWDLERWCRELPRRGACAHPDGAVRFISSALRVFAAQFAEHARHGRCERCNNAPMLPAPMQPRYAAAA